MIAENILRYQISRKLGLNGALRVLHDVGLIGQEQRGGVAVDELIEQVKKALLKGGVVRMGGFERYGNQQADFFLLRIQRGGLVLELLRNDANAPRRKMIFPVGQNLLVAGQECDDLTSGMKMPIGVPFLLRNLGRNIIVTSVVGVIYGFASCLFIGSESGFIIPGSFAYRVSMFFSDKSTYYEAPVPSTIGGCISVVLCLIVMFLVGLIVFSHKKKIEN